MALVKEQKTLFTPGPLCTSKTVKQAMQIDIFPRSQEFTDITLEILRRILDIAGAPPEEWNSLLLQGTGTYGLESVIHTVSPKNKETRVLILHNGFYATRLVQICQIAEIEHDVIDFGEAKPYDLTQIEEKLSARKYVAVVGVHCETSTGMVNPIEAVAYLTRAKQPSAAVVVDAMSSFTAVPLSFDNLDFVVTSPNKVTQAVPGCSFILCRTKRMQEYKGNARTLTLDLVSTHAEMHRLGQFRFTPPSHIMLAALQALREYEAEGGPSARRERYQMNAATLVAGARRLGFKTLLPDEYHSPICTSFLYPKHPKFQYEDFCKRLHAKGLVLFPGNLLKVESFRVGTMGNIFPSDIERLLKGMEEVLKDMNVPILVS